MQNTTDEQYIAEDSYGTNHAVHEGCARSGSIFNIVNMRYITGFASAFDRLPEFVLQKEQSLASRDNSALRDATDDIPCPSKNVQENFANIFSTNYPNYSNSITSSLLDAAKMSEMKNISESSSSLNLHSQSEIETLRLLASPLVNETFFATRFVQLLREYYGKIDPQFFLPLLPVGDFLQKLHLHFRSLQNLAAAAAITEPSANKYEKVTTYTNVDLFSNGK